MTLTKYQTHEIQKIVEAINELDHGLKDQTITDSSITVQNVMASLRTILPKDCEYCRRELPKLPAMLRAHLENENVDNTKR